MNGFSAADMRTAAANGHAEGYQAGYADAVKAVEAGSSPEADARTQIRNAFFKGVARTCDEVAPGIIYSAAAQEAVAWQRKYLGATRGGRAIDWHNITREEFEQTKSGKWSSKYEVRELYAAPVAAAPVEYKVMAYQEVTPTDEPDVFNAKIWALAPGMKVPDGCTPLYWRVGENVPHYTSLNGDKCFTVEDLARAFPASTPAAPGIGLRNALLQLREDALHMKDPGDTVNAYDRVLRLIDASPKGGSDEASIDVSRRGVSGHVEGEPAGCRELIPLLTRAIDAIELAAKHQGSISGFSSQMDLAKTLREVVAGRKLPTQATSAEVGA